MLNFNRALKSICFLSIFFCASSSCFSVSKYYTLLQMLYPFVKKRSKNSISNPKSTKRFNALQKVNDRDKLKKRYHRTYLRMKTKNSNTKSTSVQMIVLDSKSTQRFDAIQKVSGKRHNRKIELYDKKEDKISAG